MGIDQRVKCITKVFRLYNLGPGKQGGHFLFFNLHMASDTLLFNCGSLIMELSEYLDTFISTDLSS